MSWTKGREQIETLLHEGYLQQGPGSHEVAQMMLGQACQHLASADAITTSDPGGAYALAYDAARKAMDAVYEEKGCLSVTWAEDAGAWSRH